MRGGRYALPLALVALAAAASNASAQFGSDSLTLTWTAPSDDRIWGGSRYDIRFARFPITEANWYAATRAGIIRAHSPGTVEHFRVYGIIPGLRYFFAVKTMDFQGNWSLVSNIVVKDRAIRNGFPGGGALALAAACPNPARSVTRIGITLQRQGPVQIEVFDATGRRVRVLQSGVLPSGPTEITWDLTDDHGRSVQAGLYLIRARAEEVTTMRRVAVTR